MDEPKKQQQKKRIRNKSVKFFLTEKELELLDKKSKKAKMNRSEYIREAALKKEIVINEIKDLEEFGAFNFEINKLGTNLHQILKKINIYDEITQADVEKLRENNEKLNLVLDIVYDLAEYVKKWQQ